MSYTELDAWIDEKARGDWPFERWSIGNLPMREGYDYFAHPHGISGIGSLHYKLKSIFGWPLPPSDVIRDCLDAASEIVMVAIENSDADAHYSWLKHELWLPVLDDRLDGYESPADMLSQSLAYVGASDRHSEQALLATLGLWLIGELFYLPSNARESYAGTLIQIGVAAADAEYYRGIEEGRLAEISKLSKRSKIASEARHAANKARVLEAEAWWLTEANGRLNQAEAARQLASKFHVVEGVAKRYVSQFKRKFNKLTE